MKDLGQSIKERKYEQISRKEIERVIAMMNNFIRFFAKFFSPNSQIVKNLLDNQALNLYMKFIKFPLLGLQTR